MTAADIDIFTVDSPQRLGREAIRVLGLSALGGALEFYDFVVFVYLAHLMGALFFPPAIPSWLSMMQTLSIFAAGYLARPLGGTVMAHFGDRIGRKALFMVSLLLMAVPTLTIGLLPTYAQLGTAAPLLLLGLRICQGVAFAGEGPGATTFVAEHVPKLYVGLACGTLACGFMVGLLLGSTVAYVCQHFLSLDQQLTIAWRLPFLLGGMLGVLALWVRRRLSETPVFKQIRACQAQSSKLPISIVLTHHRRSVTMVMLGAFIQSCLFISVVLLTPQLLPQISAVPATAMLGVGIIVVIATGLGCLASGYLADRFGEAATWVMFCTLGGFCFTLFQLLTLKGALRESDMLFVVLYAASGFLLGLTGILSSMAAKMFPAQVRFTGVAFSTNLAYALSGGLTPILLPWCTHLTPWAIAVCVLGLAVAGICLGIAMRGERECRAIFKQWMALSIEDLSIAKYSLRAGSVTTALTPWLVQRRSRSSACSAVSLMHVSPPIGVHLL